MDTATATITILIVLGCIIGWLISSVYLDMLSHQERMAKLNQEIQAAKRKAEALTKRK